MTVEHPHIFPHPGAAIEILREPHESGDRYFNPGSTISLQCSVKRDVVGDTMVEVIWAKDGELLDILKRKSIRWPVQFSIRNS